MADSTNYLGANTKDYSQSIQNQYDSLTKSQNSSVDTAVKKGKKNLEQISAAGERAAQESIQQAQADRNDSYQLRSGIAQNNGDRQAIGNSQYGSIENTYDQQRASIAAQQSQLEKDVTRQVADLRSKGEYEKANAALQNAQQKFQQLYTDALRRDTSLRSNYEYETGNQRADAQRAEAYQREDAQRAEAYQREDAKIQREQDADTKSFAQKMGEMLMSKGIMPDDSMLAAMGIDKETAQIYLNAVIQKLYASGGSGGSGGGGGSKRSSSGSGSSTDYSGTDSSGTSSGSGIQFGTESAFNQRIANQVYTLASNGSYDGAMNWLGSKTEYFSAKNAQSVSEIAQKKYQQWQKKQNSGGSDSKGGSTPSGGTTKKKQTTQTTTSSTSGKSKKPSNLNTKNQNTK